MLRVNDIFTSIDGEVNGYHQGRLSTFLRLQGCNLDCGYCDTPDAKYYNKACFNLSVSEVFDKLMECGTRKITITGGEPMAQSKEVYDLIYRLLFRDMLISVETNGSYPVKSIENISYVMDYKLLSSGEQQSMNLDNFKNLGHLDFVKFVICNLNDYIEALKIINELKKIIPHTTFAFSPLFKGKQNNSRWLIDIMTSDKIDVVLNLQLHKILNVK